MKEIKLLGRKKKKRREHQFVVIALYSEMKRDGERKRVITFGHCLEIRLENFVLSHIHYSLQITYYEGE